MPCAVKVVSDATIVVTVVARDTELCSLVERDGVSQAIREVLLVRRLQNGVRREPALGRPVARLARDAILGVVLLAALRGARHVR